MICQTQCTVRNDFSFVYQGETPGSKCRFPPIRSIACPGMIQAGEAGCVRSSFLNPIVATDQDTIFLVSTLRIISLFVMPRRDRSRFDCIDKLLLHPFTTP